MFEYLFAIGEMHKRCELRHLRGTDQIEQGQLHQYNFRALDLAT